jgi:hypothetical protein
VTNIRFELSPHFKSPDINSIISMYIADNVCPREVDVTGRVITGDKAIMDVRQPPVVPS